MAITNRNSTAIADMVAVPRVPVNPARGAAGRVFESAGYVANATDDSSGGSVFRFCRVPSNARISHVLLSCADASSAGAINIGIWQTAENGGLVVDADLFASALALTGGPFYNSDQTFESGEYTFAESMKPLWEVLGLSADPNREYDVCSEITTTFNTLAAGMVLKVRYVR